MALDYFVCGSAGASSVDSLTIPIDVDVPRTDPTLGATVIWILLQVDSAGGNATAVSDDAPVDDSYSTCLFSDGLNHYSGDTNPLAGLIVNPLVAGINNITVTLGGTVNRVQAVALAITGVGGTWPTAPFDTADPTGHWIFGAIAQAAEAPFGSPSHESIAVEWTDTGGGDTPVIHDPSGATTDRNWDWVSGEVAFYFQNDNSQSSDPIDWTWSDGSIDDFDQYDVDDGTGHWMIFALGVQDPVTPGAQGPSVDGAYGSAGSKFLTSGNALALSSGSGPPPCSTPSGAAPAFNRVIPI